MLLLGNDALRTNCIRSRKDWKIIFFSTLYHSLRCYNFDMTPAQERWSGWFLVFIPFFLYHLSPHLHYTCPKLDSFLSRFITLTFYSTTLISALHLSCVILLDSELVIITIPLGRTLLWNLVSSLVWVPIKWVQNCAHCTHRCIFYHRGLPSQATAVTWVPLSWWIFPFPQEVLR